MILLEVVILSHNFYDDIYIFECYVSEEEPSKILEYEPEGEWVKFTFREPEWWRYDKLIHNKSNDCFFRVSETRKWSIKEAKKRKQLMKYGLKKIETSDGKVLTSNFKLSDETGEALSVYYSEKIYLSQEEEQEIERDLETYNNEKEIDKIKPPFHRMIIEMEIARRIGGYSREDIMKLSKKDMDIIYLLHRLGMYLPIRDYIKNIKPLNNEINNEDNFQLSKHKIMELNNV